MRNLELMRNEMPARYHRVSINHFYLISVVYQSIIVLCHSLFVKILVFIVSKSEN
jgi:hypothetical protein